MTGWGAGPCGSGRRTAEEPADERRYNDPGLGWGRGFGRGRRGGGRGAGFGAGGRGRGGRGFGRRGGGRWSDVFDRVAEAFLDREPRRFERPLDEKQALEGRADELQHELDSIRRRLDELGDKERKARPEEPAQE